MMYRKLAIAAVALMFPLQSYALVGATSQEKKAVVKAESIDFRQLLPVVEGQLKELRSGNIEKAYNDFTSERFRKATSLENYKQLVEKFKVLSKNKIFQYQEFYVEDGIATFSGDLISDGGEQVYVAFDLVNENGTWKILGMNLIEFQSAIPPRDINR